MKKNIHIEIDKNSGFCFGVVNAITQAETELENSETLYCLGEIVHNNKEVERLESLGMKTITHADLDNLEGKKVLFRAHGEPPETYSKVAKQGNIIIDASCPVVLKLQERVREGWRRMKEVDGQVVIYGIKGHAEVLGLLGQTHGNAIIVERLDEIEKIDFSRPIELFSQTTGSSEGYKEVAAEIKKRMEEVVSGNGDNLKVYNSICGQVANRKPELQKFAQRFDMVVFVSGQNSSNGRMLFELCRSVNPNSHFISSPQGLKTEWFESVSSVGICGATSTPLWLMEEVAQVIADTY